MATNGKAWAHGSATHAARVLRNMAAAAFGLPMASHANAISATTRGGGHGVINEGDLLVTTTGGLGWSCAVGHVVAAGSFAQGQGAYVGYNTPARTGTLAAHSAFIRHDLFCYRVRDTDEDATGVEDDDIVVVQGIAASTDPAIPASLGSLVILARATVPATSGTVTYTDLRPFASAIGGIILCTSATRPTVRRRGTHIWEIDTGNEYVWTGSSWVFIDKGYIIKFAEVTGSTDASGNGVVNFGFTFPVIPKVFAQVNAVVDGYITIFGTSTTTSQFFFHAASNSADVAVVNSVIQFNWLAICPA